SQCRRTGRLRSQVRSGPARLKSTCLKTAHGEEERTQLLPFHSHERVTHQLTETDLRTSFSAPVRSGSQPPQQYDYPKFRERWIPVALPPPIPSLRNRTPLIRFSTVLHVP